MVEYISQAMRQAAQEAAVLLYSPGVDPFLEKLAKGADRAIYFEEGQRDTLRLSCQDRRLWRRSHDLVAKKVLMIW